MYRHRAAFTIIKGMGRIWCCNSMKTSTGSQSESGEPSQARQPWLCPSLSASLLRSPFSSSAHSQVNPWPDICPCPAWVRLWLISLQKTIIITSSLACVMHVAGTSLLGRALVRKAGCLPGNCALITGLNVGGQLACSFRRPFP